MDGILITIIVITAFLVYKRFPQAGNRRGIKDGKQQAVVRKKDY